MAVKQENNNEPKPKRKKTGGRKAGTPNKVTKSVRESLRDALTGYINGINEKNYSLFTDLMQIQEPAGRLAMVAKFLPYVAPKLRLYRSIMMNPETYLWRNLSCSWKRNLRNKKPLSTSKISKLLIMANYKKWVALSKFSSTLEKTTLDLVIEQKRSILTYIGSILICINTK